MSESYKIVILGSTGGGVLSHALKHSFARDSIQEVVADRDCGLLSVARDFGLHQILLPAKDGAEFSDALLKRYGDRQDLLFLSFYTRLLSSALVCATKGRIFNCHPSLLPSFKGLRGFEDTLTSSAMFMGCTLHQVDTGVDTGKCVIQAAYPIDRNLPFHVNRHKIFLMQYYTTLQFFKWVHENRLQIDHKGIPVISGLRYRPSVFSPNLDEDFFKSASIDNELTK